MLHGNRSGERGAGNGERWQETGKQETGNVGRKQEQSR